MRRACASSHGARPHRRRCREVEPFGRDVANTPAQLRLAAELRAVPLTIVLVINDVLQEHMASGIASPGIASRSTREALTAAFKRCRIPTL
jgi:hypothetical protein